MTTRERVHDLLEQGKTCAEIARLLGLPKSTVSYHKRRLGLPMRTDCNRRYDWSQIQAHYDAGHSVRECRARFGFARPLDQLLIKGPRNRMHIKLRLIGAGLMENRCEECGIAEWRDRPLSLELHHRNGEKHDNRLENLALLCPNCHSQTDTWGGKNAGADSAATATVTVLRPPPARPDSAA
jgi:Helix-turn-helix domain/HNH endonuclease